MLAFWPGRDPFSTWGQSCGRVASNDHVINFRQGHCPVAMRTSHKTATSSLHKFCLAEETHRQHVKQSTRTYLPPGLYHPSFEVNYVKTRKSDSRLASFPVISRCYLIWSVP